MSVLQPVRTRRIRLLGALAACVVAAAPLDAQVPLTPSPVLDLRRLSPDPALSGYIAARETRRHDSTTFTISRVRLTVQARPLPFLAVRVQGGISNSTVGSASTSAGRFAFSDAYVQLEPGDGSPLHALRPALIVGQFKMPFSLEYLTPYSHLPTVNRSQAVDALTPKRDIGVMGQLHLTDYVMLSGAVANGSGANTTSNPDGRELAMARLTVVPLPHLAFAGKWAGEGADHRWGYDGRFTTRRVTVEGEVIHRRRTADAIITNASGGYALAAVKLLPWLQPVIKWERFTESAKSVSAPPPFTLPLPTPGAPASPIPAASRATWTTYGVNVVTAGDRLRLQLDWVVKSDHPVDHADELLAQVVAIL